MRPKSELIILVILLSAALCDQAEQRLTAPGTADKQTEQVTHVSDPSFNITFEQFKQKYHKVYSSVAEQNYRKLIFQQNLEELNQHNSNPQKTYRKKPNSFLDVSQDEFRSVYTTVRPSDIHSRNISNSLRKQGQCKQKHNHKNQTGQAAAFNDSLSKNSSQNYKKQAYNMTGDVQNKTASVEQAARPKRKTLKNLQSQHNLLTATLQANTLQNSSALKINVDPVATFNLTSINTVFNLTSINTASNLTPINTASNLTPINTTSNLNQTNNVYIDWSAYGGEVRYQGYCGACYAFATIDTLSAQLAIHQYDFFVGLSVQQIIDCATNSLAYGCNGGYLEGALTYIQMNGVVSEGVYPFTSGSNGAASNCKMNGGSFKLSSFKPIQQGSCSSVISELYRGPVSAGISGYNLRFYDSGIFNDCSTKDALDHAVVIMGFESGKGWLIKNSWGSDWGEKGYGWIAEGNTCWICNMTVSIVV